MPISKASSSAVAPAAKGDLVVGSATNDSGVLAVGSANQVLTVDSSTATGLKWATPASGGPANATATITTNETTTSTSFTNLTTVGPEVTVTTGTKALVIIKCGSYTTNANYAALMGCAVSGSSSISANGTRIYSSDSTLGHVDGSSGFIITGLTAGSNTFTAKYAGSGGGTTATFRDRIISVVDMGS